MSKIIGFCIVISVIALLGATGYISYDIGHSDGYSSGYYSGKQACIAEYQSKINLLNQQISEQETKIRRYESELAKCEQDLSEFTQAYTTTYQENIELRNIINKLKTEIDSLRVEQPDSDFEEIDGLLNLLCTAAGLPPIFGWF